MMQCGRLDRTELCFKQTAEGHGPAWLSLAAVTVVAGTRGLHPLLMGEGSAVNSPFVLAMRPPARIDGIDRQSVMWQFASISYSMRMMMRMVTPRDELGWQKMET